MNAFPFNSKISVREQQAKKILEEEKIGAELSATLCFDW